MFSTYSLSSCCVYLMFDFMVFFYLYSSIFCWYAALCIVFSVVSNLILCPAVVWSNTYGCMHYNSIVMYYNSFVMHYNSIVMHYNSISTTALLHVCEFFFRFMSKLLREIKLSKV